ncbi:hypothetical protein ACFL41_00415 [Gemmatimonadota bacterium]
MNKAYRALVLILLSVLTACSTLNPKYFERPRAIRDTEQYTHKKTGMVFPTDIGRFERVSIIQYDEKALHISVGYNLLTASGPVAATVYLFPSPNIISIGAPDRIVASMRANFGQQVLTASIEEILQAHDGAEVIEEKEITSQQVGQTIIGHHVTFEYEQVFGTQSQDVVSHLVLFNYVGDRWSLQFRITHSKRISGENVINQLLRNLSIPSGDS